MSAEGDIDSEQLELAQPYEPAPRRWLRNSGRWIERTVAPPDATKRRWWWERLFVPVPDPTHFLDSEEQLAARLKPAEGRSAEALAEAQALFDEPFARSEGIERRATTLQGAVAIAGSFALAGGTSRRPAPTTTSRPPRTCSRSRPDDWNPTPERTPDEQPGTDA